MRPIQFGGFHSHPKPARSESSSRPSTPKPADEDKPPAYGEHEGDTLELSGTEPPPYPDDHFTQWLIRQRQAFERTHPEQLEDEEAFTDFLVRRNPASGLPPDHELELPPRRPTLIRRGAFDDTLQAQSRLTEDEGGAIDPLEPYRITHTNAPPHERGAREDFYNHHEHLGESRVNRLLQAGALSHVQAATPRMLATYTYGNFSSPGQGRYANLRERALITHDASELRRLLDDGVHRADLFLGASRAEIVQLQDLLRRP